MSGPDVCKHLRPIGESCDICDALAEAHHAIHVQSILFEAWDRVKGLSIIKSMHSTTREAIRRAICGCDTQD